MKKYSIKKRIGRGAMAEVFLARDNVLQRDVAVKKLIIDPNLGFDAKKLTAYRNRFKQEALAAARLNHPNIVTIHEVLEYKNEDYMVMELLPGRPLKNWIDDRHSFSYPEIAKIGGQICRGLDYAHQNGVIHRDIKPDNLFLDADLNLKISDFGVARLATDSLVKTTAGTFVGTPLYSSPEQWKREANIDGRADLYSVGVVLYQLITHDFPFWADDIEEFLGKIMSEPPAPIESHVSGVPSGLAGIVEKSLHKNPNDRYATGREMAEALESFMTSFTRDPGGDSSPGPDAGQTRPDHAAPTLTIADGDMPFGRSTLAEASTLVRRDLDFTHPHWVCSLMESWPQKDLGSGRLGPILDKLLDTPLHADPFTGAVMIDRSYLLLVWRGILLQALALPTDTAAGETTFGDKVFRSIPETGESFRLFTAADEKAVHLPLLVHTILAQTHPLHRDLDAGIIDIPGLIGNLARDRFTGVVRLGQEQRGIYLGFYAGTKVFILQSKDVEISASTTVLADLNAFLKKHRLKVDIFESQLDPLPEGCRRLFSDNTLYLQPQPRPTATFQEYLGLKKKKLPPGALNNLKGSHELSFHPGERRTITLGAHKVPYLDIIGRDFLYRFVQWFVYDLFVQLLGAGNKDSLKYIATWIPEITAIRIGPTLTDDHGNPIPFDLATLDGEGKILHVVRRGKTGRLDEVSRFLEDTISVKTHLLKTGDIGAGVFVSPEGFTGDVLDFFRERTEEQKKLVGVSLLDAFTGYKGFVRMGKNRGFHFGLVSEIDGLFELTRPVL